MNSYRGLALLVTLGLALVVLTSGSLQGRQPESGRQSSLTLEQRVAYQRAIEEVYWRHRLWPEVNAGPKPTLDEVLPGLAARREPLLVEAVVGE